MLIFIGALFIFHLADQGYTRIRLLRAEENRIERMDMEDYLVGVVLAEMPASFELEALKAQAVCARTYAVKRNSEIPSHRSQASVCDDFRHCQAYVSVDDYLAANPGKEWAVARVSKAVRSTRSLIITCKDEIIDPVYHSTCGGHTESALTVWGFDHSYLQGVACPWEEGAPHHEETTIISTPAFLSKLGLSPKTTPIPRTIERTGFGRVKKVEWDEMDLSGTEVRQALVLRSEQFYFGEKDGNIAITTYGYGHRVGMCQYGANGMARAGHDFREILRYYFQGINIINLEKKK